jgi:DNA polymerase-3 subunit epsilon
MHYPNNLVSKLLKNPIEFDTFLELLESNNTFYEDPQLEFELLLSNGMPLEIENNNVVYKPTITDINDQVFCIVDIEATHGKVSKGQIIEIGAVKYQNGQMIDKFDSLVYCEEIPKHIQDITGITPKMLKNAPLLEKVLKEFKIFLGDDVFLAHSVKFDYNYLSESMELFDLGSLNNAKICTIDLAKRVIASEKYGLKFLKELLDINIDNHHRAYSDALSSTVVFEKCLKDLPNDIKTVSDLIDFSISDNLKVIKPKKKEKVKEESKEES